MNLPMKEPKEEIYIVDLMQADDYRFTDARVFSTSEAAQEFAEWMQTHSDNWTVTDIWNVSKIYTSAEAAIEHYSANLDTE